MDSSVLQLTHMWDVVRLKRTDLRVFQRHQCDCVGIVTEQFVSAGGEVGHGVGKLGENENLLAGMFFRQEFMEFGQFVILVRLPVACECENGEKPLGVLLEMLSKVFDKNVGAQPIKIRGSFPVLTSG
ncbi:MAG: hypothetical protein HY360_17120 [Verrucomicrobia bacterium]|nr:hypothetical protein [Verrucomicrobiota bacterium]